jgi:hypothetical protein
MKSQLSHRLWSGEMLDCGGMGLSVVVSLDFGGLSYSGGMSVICSPIEIGVGVFISF